MIRTHGMEPTFTGGRLLQYTSFHAIVNEISIIVVDKEELARRRWRSVKVTVEASLGKVMVAPGETAYIMDVIDDVIEGHGGWPLEGSVSEAVDTQMSGDMR